MPAWEASQLSLGLLELTVRNREAPLAIFVAPSAGRLAERLARVPA
jgi:hypothetical protein